jgi:hypothetical protein
MTGPGSFKCAAHPNVETNLRCGKCGTPICPKCMVQTPVGARCRKCAGVYKLPTYRISGIYYLRASVVALVLAVVIGIIWGLVLSGISTYFFSLIVALGIGWVIGELVSRAVNRKRGPWLAVIGGMAVVLCYAAAFLTDSIISAYIGISLYRIVFTLASIGVGVYFAVNRLR